MSTTTTESYNSYIVNFAALGIFFSLYLAYVKWQVTKDRSYRALCDINNSMSCTRVLVSKYGRGFGFIGKLFGEKSPLNLPNTVTGIIFYSLQIILTHYNGFGFVRAIAYYTSMVSVIGSLYLAYILYFVLKDICVVCNLTYFVNAAIFYFNWKIYQ